MGRHLPCGSAKADPHIGLERGDDAHGALTSNGERSFFALKSETRPLSQPRVNKCAMQDLNLQPAD